MTEARSGEGAWLLWGAAALLALLHQDFWLWDERGLVLGFLPIGLAYHAGYSLAAAGLWLLATRWVWPHHLEAWAAGDEESDAGGGAP